MKLILNVLFVMSILKQILIDLYVLNVKKREKRIFLKLVFVKSVVKNL